MDWPVFFSQRFLGNSYERWGTALLILTSGFLFFALLRALVLSRLRKLAPRTVSRWDDLLLLWVETTPYFSIFVVFLFLSARTLRLDPEVNTVIGHLFTVLAFIQIGRWAGATLKFYALPYTTITAPSDAGRATTMRALFFLGTAIIWLAVFLSILDNWGVKISALVAGLGIGGIAVSLALQNILGDLFASISILFDKPFIIGDFINVGGDMGSVEQIGLKTTRVKSLSGEQLIFSNSDLLRSRVRNFRRQTERRIQGNFGVLYETAPAKLEEISRLIRKFIEEEPKLRFERAHLAGFGDSALNYEFVYWVTEADYNLYMDIQQRFMLKLIRRFAEMGVEFAYPTRKIFFERTSHEPAPDAAQPERA